MAKKSLLKLSSLGGDYEVAFVIASYIGEKLAIAIEYYDSEYHALMPYATLTVNLAGEKCEKDCAFVDTNNLGEKILRWIADNNLGAPTGRYASSGYCAYPEVKFNMDEVRKHVK